MNYKPLGFEHFHAPLANAFFAEAQARGVQVYTDSFGRPYFFRRSKQLSPLFPETEIERVQQIKLIYPSLCALHEEEHVSPNDQRSTFAEAMRQAGTEKEYALVGKEIVSKKDYTISFPYKRNANETVMNVYHKNMWVMEIVFYE